MVGSLCRPVKELKGFDKIELAPGEKRTVSFTVNASDLAFHQADNTLAVEPGDFKLWIAPDSESGDAKDFIVE